MGRTLPPALPDDFATTFVTSSSLDDAELAESVGAAISSFVR